MTINPTRQKDLGITVPGQSSGRFAAVHHDEAPSLAEVTPPSEQLVELQRRAAAARTASRTAAKVAELLTAQSVQEAIKSYYPSATALRAIARGDSETGSHLEATSIVTADGQMIDVSWGGGAHRDDLLGQIVPEATRTFSQEDSEHWSSDDGFLFEMDLTTDLSHPERELRAYREISNIVDAPLGRIPMLGDYEEIDYRLYESPDYYNVDEALRDLVAAQYLNHHELAKAVQDTIGLESLEEDVNEVLSPKITAAINEGLLRLAQVHNLTVPAPATPPTPED